jgi:tetratricopeptide (TPR) repeat protein
MGFPPENAQAIAQDVAELVAAGQVSEAIRRYPEHEQEILTLARLLQLEELSGDPRADLAALAERESILQRSAQGQEANDWHREGLRLSRAGDYAGAQRAFDEAIRLQPDFAIAYINRAILHVLRGKQEQALADFRAAVRLAPNSEQARGMLAQAEVGNWAAFGV